jgi:hypothetical protein
MVTHLLGLFPHRKPASLSPLPHLANWCPRSRPLWGRSLPRLANAFPLSPPARGCCLLTSPHPCSLTLGWLNPVHGLALVGLFPARKPASSLPPRKWLPSARGHALAGAAPSSPAGILFPDREMANSGPLLWLSPHRKPASLTLRWLIVMNA